ncbi:aarF domain-containing kinase 1 [Neocloeon triangulifer]|uniref:aarF domain-containing kinase 1 n=1 Tax=Neocloeon triangulifer TaxID=2078957 RepID=UPI00286EC37D|nr:aarF domain-containing kinase 1 [Neocloeon triangulifer]
MLKVIKWRKVLKFGAIGGAGVGLVTSLHANNYDVTSVGVVRFANAAKAVLDISVYYKKNLYSKNAKLMDHESEEYLKLKSEVHQWGAERLLKLCCLNKGVFIKVGQHIGALDYLLPVEYVNTMKVLHSKAPKSSLKDVYMVLRQDLGKDPEEVFKSIDPEPLGTASLAQVHKAVLQDGRTVAVKVQHASVRGNSLVDLKTMEFLVSIVSRLFPDFRFEWLVKETKRNIPLELDFHNEGKNAEKADRILVKFPWLFVPKIYWNLTTPRVLTMEFVEGGQINDVEYIEKSKINKWLLSSRLGDMYSEMIFKHGFVHADPHPGNILVQPKGKDFKIILLDHGLYAELEPKFRRQYARLWLSILNFDMPAIKQVAIDLGVGDLYWLFSCMVTGRTWESISGAGGIAKSRPGAEEKKIFQQRLPQFLPQINAVLSRVDRQMLLLFKTNDLLRGIEHTLKTHGRRAALLTMAARCVQAEYSEQRKEALGALQRNTISFCEIWALLRLKVWYFMLCITDFFGLA